jgi:hypothetical protein
MNSDIFQDLHIDTVDEAETEEKKPVEVELLSQTQTATYLSSNYTSSVLKWLLILYAGQPQILLLFWTIEDM